MVILCGAAMKMVSINNTCQVEGTTPDPWITTPAVKGLSHNTGRGRSERIINLVLYFLPLGR
jgi:hypothetical protein